MNVSTSGNKIKKGSHVRRSWEDLNDNPFVLGLYSAKSDADLANTSRIRDNNGMTFIAGVLPFRTKEYSCRTNRGRNNASFSQWKPRGKFPKEWPNAGHITPRTSRVFPSTRVTRRRRRTAHRILLGEGMMGRTDAILWPLCFVV